MCKKVIVVCSLCEHRTYPFTCELVENEPDFAGFACIIKKKIMVLLKDFLVPLPGCIPSSKKHC